MGDSGNTDDDADYNAPIYRAFLNKDRNVSVLTADPGLWEALGSLLSLEGFSPKLYTRGDDLRESLKTARPTCLVLGEGANGERPLDVLRDIRTARNATPAIALVQSGAPLRTVTALMRGGALEVLEVPVDSQLLLETVRNIVKRDIHVVSIGGISRVQVLGYSTLTFREREIVERICEGMSNKEIALELDISPRTVEVHRARAMQKLGTRNTADLVRRIVAS